MNAPTLHAAYLGTHTDEVMNISHKDSDSIIESWRRELILEVYESTSQGHE